MGYIIFLLLLGFTAHFFALVSVGNQAVKAKSFENFINRIIMNICMMVVVTFGFWFFFPETVPLLIAFNMAFLISLLFVDFEATYDTIKAEGI